MSDKSVHYRHLEHLVTLYPAAWQAELNKLTPAVPAIMVLGLDTVHFYPANRDSFITFAERVNPATVDGMTRGFDMVHSNTQSYNRAHGANAITVGLVDAHPVPYDIAYTPEEITKLNTLHLFTYLNEKDTA